MSFASVRWDETRRVLHWGIDWLGIGNFLVHWPNPSVSEVVTAAFHEWRVQPNGSDSFVFDTKEILLNELSSPIPIRVAITGRAYTLDEDLSREMTFPLDKVGWMLQSTTNMLQWNVFESASLVACPCRPLVALTRTCATSPSLRALGS